MSSSGCTGCRRALRRPRASRAWRWRPTSRDVLRVDPGPVARSSTPQTREAASAVRRGADSRRPDRGGRRKAARAVLGRGRAKPACLRAGADGAFRSRFGARDGSLHRPRRLDEARGRARRRALARAPRRAPARGAAASSLVIAEPRSTPPATASSAASTAPRARSRARGAIVEDARGLDLEVRAGVHTGECEAAGQKLAGIAVHVGARVDGGRRAGRGPRLEHGQGPRRRIGLRVRGPRRARARRACRASPAICSGTREPP